MYLSKNEVLFHIGSGEAELYADYFAGNLTVLSQIGKPSSVGLKIEPDNV